MNTRDFFLGCNYWASNAGTEMWREFDESIIRKDLKILRDHGLKYLRVFPNWRDFQPVEPVLEYQGKIKEYRMEGGKMPKNRYYLDEEMLKRFGIFCDVAQEFGFKLIVGLLTGWMSSRTFIPTALLNKNLITDPLALHFEQLLVMGIVERFKEHPAIFAWDHGNECQCLGDPKDHFASYNWAQLITNAVRAVDKEHLMISGINSLSTDGLWRIDEQAEVSDMTVTHPYPFWGQYTANDTNTYIKTSLYATALTRLYKDLGKKPCLVEEVGTMGPSVCSEELAPKTLRANYFSTLANGGCGILWWCANEQIDLMTTPYTWTMVENELGMIYKNGDAKPVLKEMQRLSKLSFDIPDAEIDGVCLLTEGQDTWGVAYMTYILSKQAGLNISFCDAKKEIPEASLYIMPSISGGNIMPKENYLRLKEYVKKGAKLYISQNTGFLSEFEDLTGNKIIDSEMTEGTDTVIINGKEISYSYNRRLYLENTNATVINEHITKNSYGKGEVWYVDFPVEAMLIDKNRAFDNNVHEIYRLVFKNEIQGHIIKCNNENVTVTVHNGVNTVYGVFVNHSEKTQKINIETELTVKNVIYGNTDSCETMDAVILEFNK